MSGNDQSAVAGSELPDPLVVRVTDASGRAVSGLSVVWVISEGGGSVEPLFTVTDGSGRASTRWTLGRSPGRNRVNAVASGVGSVRFEARATAGGDGDDGDDGDDRVVRIP
jgi:adhesin/invasin